MNKLFAIATLTLLSVCLYSININTVDYKAKFEQWITQYNKNYSPAERAYRQAIYEKNLKMIEAHNADPNESYTMGENQFADLTHEEFVEIYLTVKPRKEEIQEEKYIPPKSPNILGVDWSYITKVKNQGQCGGCWAFSAIGAIEGFLRATYVTETYPDLSEQQLIDCDDFSYGCKGGWPYSGIRWVAENQILPESKYPYVGIKQTCASNKGEYYSRGYKKVDPEVLYSALWSQPVSVCVDASNWQFYKSGIFDNCEKNINHGVLAVGYATNYWIVKNSWGTSWGNEGFIKLARSVDNYDTCAISQQAYIAY